MVMRKHRFGFLRSCISVCHQQGRPFLASLDLPVERIEAVYHGFELRRESEVIHWRGEYHHIGGHKVRTKLPEIVVEYTLTVHSATVAGDAGRNLALGAIEMVHLVSGFFRTLDELSGQMIGIPVPARTSCQYYYFHFLIRFIVQQFGCRAAAHAASVLPARLFHEFVEVLFRVFVFCADGADGLGINDVFLFAVQIKQRIAQILVVCADAAGTEI